MATHSNFIIPKEQSSRRVIPHELSIDGMRYFSEEDFQRALDDFLTQRREEAQAKREAEELNGTVTEVDVEPEVVAEGDRRLIFHE